MERSGIPQAILKGVIAIFMIAFLTSIVFAFLLKFTTIAEDSLQWVITALSFIAFFIGGFISGKSGGEKGWLLGGATALLFSCLVFLLQFLGYDEQFSLLQLLYHGGFLIAACFGGIIGVNIATNKT